MKKKIIIISSVMCLALAAGLFFGQSKDEVSLSGLAKDNVEALADGYCPNGCTDGGGGCDCNGWHDCYHEYQWPQPE
ncbi:MAG: NVEALA domain-containing protein [Tannerellaceae bacterium]|jgi:hypothetical protein|nr:NVEALA domain-containing protein [Tannerellaceae bacterium]